MFRAQHRVTGQGEGDGRIDLAAVEFTWQTFHRCVATGDRQRCTSEHGGHLRLRIETDRQHARGPLGAAKGLRKLVGRGIVKQSVVAPATDRQPRAAGQRIGGLPRGKTDEERCFEGERDGDFRKCPARVHNKRRGVGHGHGRLCTQAKKLRLVFLVDDDGRGKNASSEYRTDGQHIDGAIVAEGSQHGLDVTHRWRGAAQVIRGGRVALTQTSAIETHPRVAQACLAGNKNERIHDGNLSGLASSV